MARMPIHPGEHLAEELREIDISAAELARNMKVPTNRVTEILKWAAIRERRYGVALSAFLRHERPVLAESANAL